jgi:hypothetical protein
MRRRTLLAGAALVLIAGCAGDQGPQEPVVYDTWLYDSGYWYDDDFWAWLDDQEDDIDPDDFRDKLNDWYEGLDPEDQEDVRQRVEDWLEAHDLEPLGARDPRALIESTILDRWNAMEPAERQAWLDTRADRAIARDPTASPAARAQARDRLAGLDRETLRSRPDSWGGTRLTDRDLSRFGGMGAHPLPARDGMRAGNVGFSRGGMGGGGMRGGGRRR